MKKLILLFMLLGLASFVYSDIGDGLILYYTFDSADTNGVNIHDKTDNSNNGILIGDGQTGVDGVLNEAYYFDGSNSYVNVNDTNGRQFTNLSDDRTLSFSFWLLMNESLTGRKDLLFFYEDFFFHFDSDFKLAVGSLPTYATFNTAYDDLTVGKWYHIAVTSDGENARLYINGSLEQAIAFTPTGTVSSMDLSIGAGSQPVSIFTEATFDELGLWNRTLTSTQITAIYNDGGGLSYPFTAVTFENPTPADGSANNSQVNINLSCGGGSSVTLWFDNNADPVTKVLDAQPSPADYTTAVVSQDTYYYKGSCDGGVSNSSVRSWSYDTDSPTITLNPRNAFDTNNYSTVQQYNYTMPINITITDNIDLYGFMINITNPDGVEKFSYTNEALSGVSYTYNTSVDVNAWDKNKVYNIEILASDSHTANVIKPYDVEKKNAELKFNTEENNEIIIQSLEDATTDAVKQKDRYNFKFNFDNKGIAKREFLVKSDHKIVYKNSPLYPAWFVIYNPKTKSGNWIDFAGAGKPTVTKINDYEYKVTFSSLADNVEFNSIGGLNIKQEFYTWYLGDYNLISPTALSELNITLALNITNNTVNFKNIEANLIYNGTNKGPAGISTGQDYFYFNTTFAPPTINNNTYFSYYWNVTVTQADDSKLNFNLTGLHLVSNWGIDNCTLYSIPAFNFTIYDEKTGSPLVSNVTFSLNNYYVDGDNSIKKSFNVILSGKSNYSFCKSGDFDFRGDMANIITRESYGTRNFYRNSVLYEGLFNAYLLVDDASTSYITFKIVDGALTPITGAEIKINRIVNSINTEIYQGYSDFAGQMLVFLDQLYTYDFSILAEGYPIKNFSLQPSDTTYTIVLSEGGTPFPDTDYQNIRFKVTPKDTLLNASGEYVTFTFEVDGTGLEEIGINITNHAYTCVPASCSQVLATTTGGTVSIQILLDSQGTFNTAYWFKRPGGNRIYVNDNLIKVALFTFAGDNSLLDFLAEIKTSTSANTRSLLFGVISIVVVGIGASIGLFGTLLVIPLMFVLIMFSLPIVYNGVAINLIHPFVGLFMVIFGVVVYLISQMQGGG